MPVTRFLASLRKRKTPWRAPEDSGFRDPPSERDCFFALALKSERFVTDIRATFEEHQLSLLAFAKSSYSLSALTRAKVRKGTVTTDRLPGNQVLP